MKTISTVVMPLTVAKRFVDDLTEEEIRVYAKVPPTLKQVRNYQARTTLETLIHAICQDRVGRAVTP